MGIMQLTDLKCAQIFEEAERYHAVQQMTACAKLFPSENVVACPVADGGIAAISLPMFGAKLNRIVGLGMSGPVFANDLLEAERLYAAKGLSCTVHQCPLADSTTLDALAAGGYTVNGFINVHARVLSEADLEYESNPRVTIRQITADKTDELNTFTEISVKGCATNGRPHILLKSLAQIAAMRADTRLYLAYVDGQLAGSGGLALIWTSYGTLAHIYIDSTVAEFRGQGVQRALLLARLRDARLLGCELASADVRPGTGSARNVERSGFSLAYTKPIFEKPLNSLEVADQAGGKQ